VRACVGRQSGGYRRPRRCRSRAFRRARGEPADLELDDDEAGLRPVEKQQVDVEVVAVDGEVVLPGDEREPVAELEQERLQPLDQSRLEVPFGGRTGQVEEVQNVGIAGQLLRQLESLAGSWSMKFEGAVPARSLSRFMIWLITTLRDQPCSAAAAAYQSRCP